MSTGPNEQDSRAAATPAGPPVGSASGQPAVTPRPFVAPCRDLHPAAPLQWLKRGWADFRAAPLLSLTWGLFAVAIFALVAWGGWVLGRWVVLLSVLSGFIFIAPLFAFALYAVSRQLFLGQTPDLVQSIQAARRPFANSLVFALVLLITFLLWARAGSMVHIFFPAGAQASLADLATFLLIGSAVGSVFALVTFAASAFSLPFIANREVDAVTAVVSSINAVLRNKWTMLSWAAIIVALTAIGFATALVGFAIIIPWLGYATWHGYREALDASAWPPLAQPPRALDAAIARLEEKDTR